MCNISWPSLAFPFNMDCQACPLVTSLIIVSVVFYEKSLIEECTSEAKPGLILPVLTFDLYPDSLFSTFYPHFHEEKSFGFSACSTVILFFVLWFLLLSSIIFHIIKSRHQGKLCFHLDYFAKKRVKSEQLLAGLSTTSLPNVQQQQRPLDEWSTTIIQQKAIIRPALPNVALVLASWLAADAGK